MTQQTQKSTKSVIDRRSTADKKRPLWQSVAASIALLAAAIVLVVILVRTSGLSAAQVTESILSIPLWLLVLATVLTITQVAISSVKWRLVLRAMAPDAERSHSFSFFFWVSVLAAFLSQLLTVYVASVLVRGWAVRRFSASPALRGATSSAVEQVFDVFVLVAMAAPTLIVWAIGGGFTLWICLTLGSLIVIGGAGLSCLKLLLRTFPALENLHPKLSTLRSILVESHSIDAPLANLFQNLYLLSVLRYMVTIARVPLILAVMGLAVDPIDGLQSATLTLATQLVSLTPGNIGLAEWTWAGALVFRGYDLTLATQVAIILRVAGVATLTLTLGGTMLLSIFGLLAARSR